MVCQRGAAGLECCDATPPPNVRLVKLLRIAIRRVSREIEQIDARGLGII